MKIKNWYSSRGPKFIWQRGEQLLNRYGLSPAKAISRIERCMELLAKYDCFPTLPTPGAIVQRYPDFVNHLQDLDIEIAVHGHQHVNLNDYPLLNAKGQLQKAVQIFEKFGIKAYGFRCPYVGCSEALVDSLPEGMFNYSSNRAIRWDLPIEVEPKNGYLFYDKLNYLYHARNAEDTVCIPESYSNLIEIPVCIPDDLQLYYGLNNGVAGITQTWTHTLNRIFKRGELFTLLFHTELAELCEQPFVEILTRTQELHPSVWIANLREISTWWLEKSKFNIDITNTENGLHLSFNCSPRATILARGLEQFRSERPWDRTYYQLKGENVDVPKEPRPFVGLHAGAPPELVIFLREQGYLLDMDETATRCGIYLDQDTLNGLSTQVQLVDHIERSNAPLIRYWRWPNGAKCALSITGDMDALSLLDYASRLLNR